MKRAAVIALIALLAAAGCASTDELDRPARTRVYETGRPVFDLEASQEWSERHGRIAVALGLPRASLVYVRSGSSFVATYEATVRARPEEGERVAAQVSFADTLRLRSHEETQSFEPVYHRRTLSVSPGTYIVEATVIDGETDEAVTRRQRVRVAPPGEGAAMSRIRMAAVRRDSAGFSPVLAYHLAGRPDSLRAGVSLYHLRRTDTARVVMRLLHLPSDTTAARPPHWFMPSRGSIIYQGIRFDEADTLQHTRRVVTHPESNLQFAFTLPDLPVGVYRLEVETRTGPQQTPRDPLLQTRTFTVRTPSFPRVETLEQMIPALAYIAKEDEMEKLTTAASPSEMKRRFDNFWGTLIPQKQHAADVIRRYFSRVENANRRYTTYKPGWKTDRGMLYILLGEPLYKDRQVTTMTWHYSYDERDPHDTFQFKKVPFYGDGQHFEHWLLLRKSYYERVWQRALQQWRDGEGL